MEAYPTGDGCKLLELPAVEMRQILDLYPVPLRLPVPIHHHFDQLSPIPTNL